VGPADWHDRHQCRQREDGLDSSTSAFPKSLLDYLGFW
jgi:hypothetical protein